jgi:hypothetical protein
MKLVDLNAPNTQWEAKRKADMLETIEMWAEAVRADKYDAIALCGVLKDGSIDTNVPVHNQHGVLVGAVATLQHVLIAGSRITEG